MRQQIVIIKYNNLIENTLFVQIVVLVLKILEMGPLRFRKWELNVMVEIYFKSLVRANGKVLLIKFS